VESGNAELAVLWGPQAGRYVKAAGGKLDLRIIPDTQTRADGERVPFHYSTSVGVKKGNTALMEDIGRALKKRAKEIQALLKAEGIPLLPLSEAERPASRKRK